MSKKLLSILSKLIQSIINYFDFEPSKVSVCESEWGKATRVTEEKKTAEVLKLSETGPVSHIGRRLVKRRKRDSEMWGEEDENMVETMVELT